MGDHALREPAEYRTTHQCQTRPPWSLGVVSDRGAQGHGSDSWRRWWAVGVETLTGFWPERQRCRDTERKEGSEEWVTETVTQEAVFIWEKTKPCWCW